MTQLAITKDLRQLFGAAREQGQRPTCLAFAMSDAHASLRHPWAHLSCEFLFYHAQRRAGRSPNVGATLPATLQSLFHEGQPAESGWPYLSKLPADLIHWTPPLDCGPTFHCSGKSAPTLLDDIIAALDTGRPVVVLMTISRSFFSGKHIVDAGSEEPPEQARGHAVIAVGHGQVSSQRAILIRNSWGPRWGDGGYAWITERYLLPRVYDVALLTN